jgi:hypothetical protein
MKKKPVFRASTLSVAIAIALAGCGGGGGGTSNGNNSPASSTPNINNFYGLVPYSTPRLVGTIDPLEKNTSRNGAGDMFAADITGDGGQDVIFAGRMGQAYGPTRLSRDEWSNSRLSMFTWEGGTMVDKTAQWFPDNSNIILGTEPSVQFADFDKSGKLDMFVAAGTDSNSITGPASIFFNEGNKFTRLDVPVNSAWGHHSALADFNNDGYTDFIVLDYGANTTVGINTKNRGFVTYIQDPYKVNKMFGGSGIAAADFMNSGRSSVVITDVGSGADTVLFDVSLVGASVDFTEISKLPKPRFNLPKYAEYGFGTLPGQSSPSHTIRASAHDFNNNGKMDVIAFSIPTGVAGNPNGDNSNLVEFSEIQFLDNQGNGNFVDVTDDILVGYDNRGTITYNPKFVDLNNDGLTDILVSGADWDDNLNSHQFLMKTADGKFVAAYQNVLSDFVSQTNAMQSALSANTVPGGQYVNLIKDPSGKLFLMTAVSYRQESDGDFRQAVYLSELLNDGTVVTPKMSSDMLKTAWPYLTDGAVNQVLAQSGKTYLNGTIIDTEAAFRPVGDLSLALGGRTGAIRPLSGYISGIKLSPRLSKIAVVDELRRDFQVDVSGTSVNRKNVWTQTRDVSTNYVGAETTQGMSLTGGIQQSANGYQLSTDQTSQMYSFGAPAIRLNDYAKFHVQVTNLNFSPWLAMDGIWGKVNSTFMAEFVTSFQKDNWVLNTGAIWAKTDINPGLVTSVDDIWSLWAEAGFSDAESGWGAFVGIKPWAVSGAVNLNLPTGTDSAGTMQYANESVAIQNNLDTYARVAYSFNVTKNMRGSVGGIMFSNGQSGVTANLQFKF